MNRAAEAESIAAGTVIAIVPSTPRILPVVILHACKYQKMFAAIIRLVPVIQGRIDRLVISFFNEDRARFLQFFVFSDSHKAPGSQLAVKVGGCSEVMRLTAGADAIELRTRTGSVRKHRDAIAAFDIGARCQ